MKLLSLFSGIGAFEKALSNLGIDYELVNYCEIDKYASKVYSTVHECSESLNLGDITKVKADDLPDFDLMTWGFPCTNISIAGKQTGLIHNNKKTHSGLYYDGMRILKTKRPAISIIENVKNLMSKKFQETFTMILNDLTEAGYNTYYSVLNAVDYGIPQNRERVFIVSIRQDIDDHSFEFPTPCKLSLCLNDILLYENEVNPKYYLNSKQLSNLQWRSIPDKKFGDLIQVASLSDKNHQHDRVYSPVGIAPCLNTGTGGNLQPKILMANNQIRKLTPKEYWRLMGFSDDDFNKISGVSDTQLYKQAGNSIVVNVLEAIFKNLKTSLPKIFEGGKHVTIRN